MKNVILGVPVFEKVGAIRRRMRAGGAHGRLRIRSIYNAYCRQEGIPAGAVTVGIGRSRGLLPYHNLAINPNHQVLNLEHSFLPVLSALHVPSALPHDSGIVDISRCKSLHLA
jgi:hypothetical protein